MWRTVSYKTSDQPKPAKTSQNLPTTTQNHPKPAITTNNYPKPPITKWFEIFILVIEKYFFPSM